MNFLNRFFKLIAGLVLFSIGIVMTIQANIGYAPWDVFHAGLSKQINTTFGVASILVGLVICVLTLIMGEKLGLGSILNMLLIGIFLDIIMYFNLIPQANSFLTGLFMLIIGMFIISFGSYFYIGSGFGAGPRDSLMVALVRKTKLPVGLVRISLELITAIIGLYLGGLFGIGTLISAFAVGICVQITFNALKFDTTQVEHETVIDTYKALKNIS